MRVGDNMRDNFTQVIATLGRECRDWADGVTNTAILSLIEDNCRPDEVIIYTDGSVLRGEKSGWAYSAAQHYITLKTAVQLTSLHPA